MNGRLVSDYVMKAAQTFWYFKRHDGTKNWDALGAE
jgi:hypothetical protein